MRADVASVLAGLQGASPLSGVLVPSLAGAGEPDEPVYEREFRVDVQGNAIPGFNKDHQHFLFLEIGDLRRARTWLRGLAPRLATMDDVLAFVRAHRAQRLRTGVREPWINATWINVAFSWRAVARLAGRADADAFGEQSFRQGLAARAAYLGDTVSPEQWRFADPDVMLTVAADRSRDLAEAVDALREEAVGHRLRVVFEQRGDTLPGALRGHEHFGFKDGISQPGVRGRASSAPGDFITPRYLSADDPHARLYGKPGQPLIWPGQFLLGEPRQDTQDLYAPAAPAANFPAWARRGSYVVVRRLRQDVPAFWEFVIDTASRLGVEPVRFASMLVGRWPSGAPLMRSPREDKPRLAGDELANNAFLYEDDTRRSAFVDLTGYPDDRFAAARADVLGEVCPHFAHIRKVNPRDAGTDLGTPADTLLRLMLRRGIPFGPPLAGVEKPSAALVRKERGLLFVAYAATIEDQFEFITRRWVNSALHPRFGGVDPVIGRRGEISFAGRQVALDREWIVPTGGGYFFAPPVSAVAEALGRAG